MNLNRRAAVAASSLGAAAATVIANRAVLRVKWEQVERCFELAKKRLEAAR